MSLIPALLLFPDGLWLLPETAVIPQGAEIQHQNLEEVLSVHQHQPQAPQTSGSHRGIGSRRVFIAFHIYGISI